MEVGCLGLMGLGGSWSNGDGGCGLIDFLCIMGMGDPVLIGVGVLEVIGEALKCGLKTLIIT